MYKRDGVNTQIKSMEDRFCTGEGEIKERKESGRERPIGRIGFCSFFFFVIYYYVYNSDAFKALISSFLFKYIYLLAGGAEKVSPLKSIFDYIFIIYVIYISWGSRRGSPLKAKMNFLLCIYTS